MLRISQLKLPVEHTEKDIKKELGKQLRVKPEDILEIHIVKKSIDARKGQVNYVYTIDFTLAKPYAGKLKNIVSAVKKSYSFSPSGTIKMKNPPVVVGSGPGGLFCAYQLAKNGYKPLLIERGYSVEEREKAVETFWNTGILNPESNVQFGEGGAGTFSDGKLNTAVNDKNGRNTYVLETFVKHGAPEEICYDGKPHIGTDILKHVVKSMREKIIEMGGSVRFQTKLTGLSYQEGALEGIYVNDTEFIPCDTVVLALGHSARDTFSMLSKEQIIMEPKAFAVGVRVEHEQRMINRNQYGEAYFDKMPAAPYKLARTVETGRNVYSFCMCPGGYVVNAASEEGMLAVNGMSYSGRDSGTANAAIIVNVTPEDFPGAGPLAGLEFQRGLEKLAYEKGKGKIPVQLYGDFCENRISTGYGEVQPRHKGEECFGNLREVLPEYISESLIQGMTQFGRILPGFDREDTIMAGVESRTSSPLRIVRGESMEASIAGVYPCGEGAGYAGGITSAAMDGIKVAEAIMTKHAPAE